MAAAAPVHFTYIGTILPSMDYGGNYDNIVGVF